MMFKAVMTLCAGVCAAMVAGCARSQGPDDGIRYSFALPDGFQRLSGELSFSGDADGASQIRLPGEWGPEAGLDGQFSDWRVSVAGGPFEPVPVIDGVIRLEHAASAPLVLRYEFSQDYEGLPQWGVQRVPGLRPVTQPDFAVFVGAAAFPHPVWSDDRTPSYSVSFSQDGLPVSVRSSLGDGSRLDTGPIPASRFLDTLWILGGFDQASRVVNGVNIRTALRGDLPLAPDEIQTQSERMIAGAADLFQDTPFETYLIVAMPLPPLPDQSAVIGTAFHQTFMLLTTANAPAEEIRHTVSHEVLHEWITGRMGPTDTDTDPSRMWFTEGFTEYFALLVRLRVGDLDLDGFLAAINALEARYQASSVRTMTRMELIDHVWDSRETERLPYQRGALLAFLADGRAAAGGAHRLADVLAGLIDEAQAHRAVEATALALTDDRIRAALEQGLGPEAWQEIDRVTGEGGLLSEPALPLFNCLVRGGENGAWQVMDGVEPDECRAGIAGGGVRP